MPDNERAGYPEFEADEEGVSEGVCGSCGETKLVVHAKDPFMDDVYDEEVWGDWCGPCIQERADDI